MSDVPGRNRWLLPLLVLAGAVAVAVFLYARFLPDHRLLWNDFLHDRHAHLYSGLSLATDVRHFRVGQFLSDLDKFRTWPPFHDGLLVGTALFIGGGDPRWAVLPSLLSFVGTAFFAFLLVRRAAPWGGSLGGVLAALLVLVSPAQRAFATDVMLESIGACLTLSSLYFYLVALQQPSVRAGRLLGFSLSALFFSKYNYWELTLLAMAVDQFWRDPFGHWAIVHGKWRDPVLRAWVVRQFRHPLNYLLGAMIVVILLINRTGGTTIDLGGKPVSIRSSTNLVTAAYAVFFLRAVLWWRRRGHAWVKTLGPVARSLVCWHVWPVALWFLWPQRLHSFIWFSNPSANAGEHPSRDLWGGYSYYWSCLTNDYHVTLWSVAAILGLMAVAVGMGLARRLRPGAAAILWLALIGFVLCANHPNRKSRFLHSWIAVTWVGAGIGAGCLLRPSNSAAGRIARFGLGAAIGALGAAHLPTLDDAPRAPEGGIYPSGVSSLDVSDGYLPHMAESRQVTVLSNLPMKFFTQWTYMQRYARFQRLETDIRGFDPANPKDRHGFEQWLAAAKSDTVVCVDVLPGGRLYAVVPGNEGLVSYAELMASQNVFTETHRETFPEHGCVVTVWKRPGG